MHLKLVPIKKESSYIKIYGCGLHGRIVLSDKTEYDFFSKEEAGGIVGTLFKEKKIDVKELVSFDGVIFHSKIPRMKTEINYLHWVVCGMPKINGKNLDSVQSFPEEVELLRRTV
jgi:hypothetical protein